MNEKFWLPFDKANDWAKAGDYDLAIPLIEVGG